jgi:hypothetical protein
MICKRGKARESEVDLRFFFHFLCTSSPPSPILAYLKAMKAAVASKATQANSICETFKPPRECTRGDYPPFLPCPALSSSSYPYAADSMCMNAGMCGSFVFHPRNQSFNGQNLEEPVHARGFMPFMVRYRTFTEIKFNLN